MYPLPTLSTLRSSNVAIPATVTAVAGIATFDDTGDRRHRRRSRERPAPRVRVDRHRDLVVEPGVGVADRVLDGDYHRRCDGASRLRGRWLGHEYTRRLVRSPADPTAQLMELAQPEPVRILDNHHRCVGDVDSNLDHCCCNQHVGQVAIKVPTEERLWPRTL